ncbi:hypothetical protein AZE42_09078 [Rhizopogon vesiculosus]|uniref:Uncharacterized protein n=1 Tax=Rhizopogon vesiculosus TaxID=180088 RepID=A0A1J8QNH9_9AGAM|nr:hypothetical protein AZE42_09078 [Rhizopogon vesiculosus]
MDDSESYAPPAWFQVNARDTSQHIQVIQNNNLKGKGVDQPGDVGSKNYNCASLTQGSCSRASITSFTIDEMDDDDEPSVSSALTSKCDQRDLTRTALTSEDSDDDLYQSVKSDVGDDYMDVEDSPLHNDARDLVQSINGMYRVLDLISEQGSGGLGDIVIIAKSSYTDSYPLVDKIIIAQDSLRTFINTVCPGAYVSMTKVNFGALDRFIVKPIGIYGSKEEIVRLLSSLGVIDDHVAVQLVANNSGSSVFKPTLRSGLYIVRTNCEATSDEQLFIVYWPEDSTWDDSAPSSMKRNRVTFMRYLTKLCDQVTALISPEHARSIVWSEQDCKGLLMEMEEDQDESDRMFTCEVTKTSEQEEAVTPRPGFKATSEHIVMPQPHPEAAAEKPWLLYGETTQGFMTIGYHVGRWITNVWNRKSMSLSRMQLGDYLKNDTLRVNENLEANALHLLIDVGLRSRFPQLCKQFQQESTDISSKAKTAKESKEASIKENLKKDLPGLIPMFHMALVDAIIEKFPQGCFHPWFLPCASRYIICPVEPAAAPFTPAEGFSPPSMESKRDDSAVEDCLQALVGLYPEIGGELHRTVSKLDLGEINHHNYKSYKKRIRIVQSLRRQIPDVDMENNDSLRIILYEDMKHVNDALKAVGRGAIPHEQPKGFVRKTWGKLNPFKSSGPDSEFIDGTYRDTETAAYTLSDALFLAELDNIEKLPLMDRIVVNARAAALDHFKSLLTRYTEILTRAVLQIQIDQCLAQVLIEVTSDEEQQKAELRKKLIAGVNDNSQAGRDSESFQINIDSVKDTPYKASSVHLIGSRESFEKSKLKFTIHLMQLTAQDLQSLQFDSTTIPSPKFRNSYSFKLPFGYSVVRAQLLEGERILLATTDRVGNLIVHLEHLTAIEGALTHGGRRKKLDRDRIGKFILAFDESRRMLSVVATEKLLVHIFVYDDTRGFQANGSAINLTQWYPEGTSISHACFICGSDELLLVDSFTQARVYSLTTMQFRPATLNLIHVPIAVHSTPDGSCLITAHARGSDLALTAYHWRTFGSTDGIPLDILDLPVDQPLLLTSLTSRNIVHLVALDVDAQSCQSFALNITRKVTEFAFKKKGARGGAAKSVDVTAHNCLIDCHAEVWTSFPVLPAVQRETITSSTSRCPRTLVFITDRDHQIFAPYFHDLITHFERMSKKPTGNLLKSIVVSATTYATFTSARLGGSEWSVSKFRAGEWLAEFLCLIPIQIAVTKENRFIPLKDGVYSTEVEKSLLGADVNHIIDSLSFGWYESLFQSYMAKKVWIAWIYFHFRVTDFTPCNLKPVKVVSSMGEQSVGKSFSLNHLVDTSFAGSAMRTTEGVWMSVTPTEDAQELYLILQVLFRNNFALSRDITGLFQSFQSSSSVLDPAANPSLFQSTLVIIIKDVVDSDTAEITNEFFLKFQKIVQNEQEANFISRLHAGQLTIIPWPVIESQEFYKLFPTLKRRLDKQKLTHNTAGQFLHVVKTLMAKLKANDWGALSQSMASHRAQLLLCLLPNALAFGLQEVNPDPEPLKNLDDDVPIDMLDTPSEFSLATGGMQQSSSREATLQILSRTWGNYDSRQHVSEDIWVENLTAHIDNLVNLRIAHVNAWMSSNVARFQSGQASIDELMREFESATVDLKSNVQLCKLTCADCKLLCVQSRLHDGQHN